MQKVYYDFSLRKKIEKNFKNKLKKMKICKKIEDIFNRINISNRYYPFELFLKFTKIRLNNIQLKISII